MTRQPRTGSTWRRGVDVKHVYWLEQTEADVPAENDWLSARESVCLSGLRFAKRRADWRLGRWTAKCAVASFLEFAHRCPRSSPRSKYARRRRAHPRFSLRTNQPRLRFPSATVPAPPSVRVAMPGVELGCDLEVIEPRSEAFVADYFTAERASAGSASLRGRAAPSGDPALERERERAESAARRATARYSECDRESH